MTNLRKPGRYAQDEVEIGRYDYDEFDEEEPDEEEIFFNTLLARGLSRYSKWSCGIGSICSVAFVLERP